MSDEIKVNRRQIEISGGRTMNLYTFDLNGEPMPEMGPDDVVATTVDTSPEQL